MKFNIGDIVCLNSGGPPMTVTNLRDDGEVEVSWVDSCNQLQTLSAYQECFFLYQKS